MIVLDGISWGTADEIREELGEDVTAELLRDWKRRGLLRAHRVGRVNFYPVLEAVETEFLTRDRTRPRRRAA